MAYWSGKRANKKEGSTNNKEKREDGAPIDHLIFRG